MASGRLRRRPGAARRNLHVILGPMMFESFTSDRTWASDPPDSFHMFLGQYGQKTAHYWRIVSPLALVTFVLTLIFNWPVVDS